jgi:hypothetical protein
MLKRLWYVIAFGWAAMVMLNGLTRAHGPTGIDVGMALAPFLAMRLLQFIVFGAQPRTVPYRPYRGSAPR